MRSRDIECTLCGHRYNPELHMACQSCPLHSDCNLVCCPACGYQTVDPQRSLLVRLARYLPRFKGPAKNTPGALEGVSLTQIPPGEQAEMVGFSDDFPADRKAYLQAFGLVLKHKIQVVQHSPVTIIRLDNIELALENDLAQGIRVQFPVIEGPETE